MKMITAIVNKEDSKNVCNELIKAGFSVTRLSTTGGFLMAGNMTLMIGTDDEKVATAYPLQVTVGGATVFVTNVERFEKL